MGFVEHQAIIVTSWDARQLAVVRKAAEDVGFGPLMTPTIRGEVNSYWSFAILPGGSKRGWADAERWDSRAENVRQAIDAMRHDDGSVAVEAVWIGFGADPGCARVMWHADDEGR